MLAILRTYYYNIHSINKSQILAYSLWWVPLSWVIEGGITMQDRNNPLMSPSMNHLVPIQVC